MKNKTLSQWINNNKLIVLGIIIILIVILVDFYFLKPNKIKEQEGKGIKLTLKNHLEKDLPSKTIEVVSSTSTETINISSTEINYDIETKKTELQDSKQEETLVSELDKKELNNKEDTFIEKTDDVVIEIVNSREEDGNENDSVSVSIDRENYQEKPKVAQILNNKKAFVKPNISYHGFYIIGNDKVAILKKSNEIMLTKVGNNIDNTNFKVLDLSKEKVILKDNLKNNSIFEILLSNESVK